MIKKFALYILRLLAGKNLHSVYPDNFLHKNFKRGAPWFFPPKNINIYHSEHKATKKISIPIFRVSPKTKILNPIYICVQDGIFHVDILLNGRPWRDEQLVNDLQKWEEQVKISTSATFLHNIEKVKTFLNRNI